jgi:type IV secretory pathway TraG/TraD family ATPase VirD4
VQLLIADEQAPEGWADELTQILGAYDRLRDSVFTTLAQTFDFLGSPGAREVVELQEGDQSFDVRRFLETKATLYLIGAQRDYGSIAPLFSALTGMIYETAKRMAEESRNGRLDPPVLFALDEAPNICPVPLHRWTSEAGSRGIPIITCIQSYKQLADVWGETRGAIIWENSTVKMFLPAGSDDDTLDKVSKLCGEYDVARVTTTRNADGTLSSSTVMESKPVFPIHKIRMLDDFTALVLKGNQKPVTVAIEPFWERRSVKRAETKAAKVATAPKTPPPRPPHRGGTPVVPTERVATIIALPRHSVDAEAGEQSG